MTGRPLTILLAIILAVLIVALVSHHRVIPVYPGEYPVIAPPMHCDIEYHDDRVELALREDPLLGRVIVYAHAEGGVYLGILKPVYDRRVVVRRGDYADFRAAIKGSSVEAAEFLKKMDRYEPKIDMFDSIVAAHDADRAFGVQKCLYPLCTRCVEACKSVIQGDNIPITLEVKPDGHIMPVFRRGKCPRCGRCFVNCPTGSILPPDKGRK